MIARVAQEEEAFYAWVSHAENRRLMGGHLPISSMLLADNLREIAFHVSPSDIARMAHVQQSWRQALTAPGFVNHVLAQHPAWPSWMLDFFRVTKLRENVHILPVLELATRGFWALMQLPGKTALVQRLVEFFARNVLRPDATVPLKDDNHYWETVEAVLLWACEREWYDFMLEIKHARVDGTDIHAYFDAKDGGDIVKHQIIPRLLDKQTQEVFSIFKRLNKDDFVFWCDAVDLIVILCERPYSLQPAAIDMPIFLELAGDVVLGGVRLDELMSDIVTRMRARPDEVGWLWVPVIQALFGQ